MRYGLDHLPPEVLDFLAERHLATLTTTSGDGSPQVTPVGMTYEPERRLARVITWATSVKARNIARRPGQTVALCQLDGGRWLTLYGAATVTDDAERTAVAVARYAHRYRTPKSRPDRVAIEVVVDLMIGRVA
jgi:PPOX class probable F420-dependent enzyme